MTYLLTPMRIILLASLLLVQSLSVQAQAPVVCSDINTLCNTMAINTPPNVPTVSDVSIRYRYSNANGDGKRWELSNNAIMRTGDCFTIKIQAKRPLYLYVMHFDSSKNLHELLSWAKHENYLRAGQTIHLPRKNKHFVLQAPTGTETFHTIVSKQPLRRLMQHYRNKWLTNTAVQHYVAKGVVLETKDIAMADDPVASRSAPKPTVDTDGRTVESGGYGVICQHGTACRATFVIKHIP
ncbi:hypothetical protein TI05_03495 [Achromatium sp. WMS3]|nr:hypothetical protein TI05_03495 [Achromatium sp. WMS3]